MFLHGLKALVDEESRGHKTEQNPNDWDDVDPFRPWVLLSKPRSLDLILLDPARVEVFWSLVLDPSRGRRT